MKKENTRKDKSGFAILFAILLASLLLVIGLSIYNISVKELVISSFETEVKKAVYAATAGFECVNYWEGKDSYGKGILTATPKQFYNGTTGEIRCGDHFYFPNGSNNDIRKTAPTNPAYDADTFQYNTATSSEFWMFLSDDESDACVHAKLDYRKRSLAEIQGGQATTSSILTVWGYNSCDLNDKRTVEKQYAFTLR
jgi:hypothetical protein